MAHTGSIKWYDAAKGFGFIRPDEGGDDVFVHISEVTKADIVSLTEGERVTFDLGPSKRYTGKFQATNIQKAPGRKAA